MRHVCNTSRKDALIEIESCLNQWQEDIPSHCPFVFYVYCDAPSSRVLAVQLLVKWSNAQQERRTNDLFFLQAARLRLEYNHLVIVIHRPFIRLRKQTTDSSTSFAMCTHAARAVSNVCALLKEHFAIHPLSLALVSVSSSQIYLSLDEEYCLSDVWL